MTRLQFAALTLAVAAPCAAQDQVWIEQFGTEGGDFAAAAAPDFAGGAYFAGYTEGALGVSYFGSGDAWLERRDADGSRIWIRQIGTFYQDMAWAVASDDAGNVFIAGETFGDLGAPKFGEFDVWMARFDDTGAQQWVRQIGSTAFDTAQAAASDGAGGVFIAGYTDGKLGGSSAGGRDAWIARYDGAGNSLWLNQLGTSSIEQARALASDSAGGVYVTGFTGGKLGSSSSGDIDAWLARYDAVGNQLWIRQFGTSGSDSANFVAPDGAGGAYAGGHTSSIIGQVAWLARYDADGNRIWIRQFGSGRQDEAAAGAPDGAGGVFVLGTTEGDLGGPPAGGTDVWMTRFDDLGNQLWLDQFGSTASDYALAAASDAAGGIMIGGQTQGDLAAPLSGSSDIWVARYGDACYVDCDGNGELDFFDFLCFQNAFATGDPYADCDDTGALDFFDFLCFQNAFAIGCPG
ncbi:MAG: hypothetical protein ACF8R7_15860 [Phycisphaerales bacterium JB039]